MNYGLELEFFVTDSKKEIIPAYKATTQLDGNPVIGELRTGVFPTLNQAVFDLKRLIYLEELKLQNRGFEMNFFPQVDVDNTFIKNLRKEKKFHSLKESEHTGIFSIYGKDNTSVLPLKRFKASLQINISKNTECTCLEGYKRHFGELFNFIPVIRILDEFFIKEIEETKRKKGIYAIKSGTKGPRIEYRSLPNTVRLLKLIDFENTKLNQL